MNHTCEFVSDYMHNFLHCKNNWVIKYPTHFFSDLDNRTMELNNKKGWCHTLNSFLIYMSRYGYVDLIEVYCSPHNKTI